MCIIVKYLLCAETGGTQKETTVRDKTGQRRGKTKAKGRGGGERAAEGEAQRERERDLLDIGDM